MECFNFFCGLFLVFFLTGNVSSSPRAKPSCSCGESNADHAGRIVNGMRTHPNKYPWMAAMFAPKGYFMCGGSIISDKNIITAGHCMFYMTNPLESTWRLGMHDLKKRDGISYRTSHYEIHPNFLNNTYFDDFDMALVTVDKMITFGHNILPICLPPAGSSYVEQKASVAGWGKLGESSSDKTAEVLMETKVWIKADEECAALTKRLIKYNSHSMVCAHEQHTDACQGDSGGPLFIETEPNRYELIGTVSFGDGCARAFPGVYGKVATVTTLNWIRNYIDDSNGEVCSDPPRLRHRRLFVPSTLQF